MSANLKYRDAEWHYLDAQYKMADDKWHYVKNIYEKRADGWHPIWEYRWEPQPWGPCSKPCGGGVQTREVRCVRNDGLYRPDIFCDGITKPHQSQVCNTQICDISPIVVAECNRWSTLYFNSGHPIYSSAWLIIDEDYSYWEGPGSYYVGTELLFTSQEYKGLHYATVKSSIRIPDPNEPDTKWLTVNGVIQSTTAYTISTNGYNGVTITGSLNLDGNHPWHGTRGDLLDGDGSGYFGHYYYFNSFLNTTKVQLNVKPTKLFANTYLSGSGSKKNDGRMCLQRTWFKKA